LERNHKAGQNPPRVVAPIEEEEEEEEEKEEEEEEKEEKEEEKEYRLKHVPKFCFFLEWRIP
jgi:hypothetical protein